MFATGHYLNRFLELTYAQVLALASYTSEGIKGLSKVGGTARRAVADKLLKSLGGRLEGFYFAFGENDAYVIFDVPDNSTAAAISLAVTGTGVIRMKMVALLTPEEMDQAMRKSVHYEPPGWEAQEVAKDLDRLIGEGGKRLVRASILGAIDRESLASSRPYLRLRAVGKAPADLISYLPTIIDSFLGLIIGMGIATVVGRLIWPVLPQRLLRDDLLGILSQIKGLLGGDAHREKIQTLLAILPVVALQAARQIRMSGCSEDERARLRALVRALQALVTQTTELVYRRHLLPEITAPILRPQFERLEIKFEQILDVLAECFRRVIAAASFRASVVRWLP
jgi:uncharacterized protein with GYD domain